MSPRSLSPLSAAAVLILGSAPVAAQQARPAVDPRLLVASCTNAWTVRHVPSSAAAPRASSECAAPTSTLAAPATALSARGKRGLTFMAGGAGAIVVGAILKGTVGGAFALGGAVALFHGLDMYISRNDEQLAPPVSRR